MAEEQDEQKLDYGPPESQKERWVKYGLNVLLAVVVAIVLAGLLIYIAQQNNRRIDTTAAGMYSLKPQTVNIIKDLNEKITLVSLYTRPEQPQLEDAAIDYVQPVEDLLEEYKRKGKNIEVEIIDPVRNPTKVDNLIETVARKYGGEVEKYKQFLDQYPSVFEQIRTLASAEAQKVQALPLDQIKSQDLVTTLVLTMATVQQFPPQLEELKEQIDRRLKLKPPDYKGATESVNSSMENFSAMAAEIIRSFGESKDDPNVPEPIRAYMAQSLPNYERMKQLADEQVEKIKNLGELKLDDLRQSLRARDAILVMGEKDMRVIGREDVWQANPDRSALQAGGGEMKPRFAGEQQISTAILGLTSEKKQKVVFLRPGGAPLTSQGFPPFQPSGPLSAIAQRLRDYNFDVLEKDLSGQWAMQSQMRGMPAEPEPSDEEIKDAIWIVLGVPSPQNMQMPMPPPSIAPKLKAHLDGGGSALVMFLPNADPLAEAIGPWGVTAKPNVIAVHELIEATDGRPGDMVEQAQRVPFIFVINEYGDHPITRPLRSLDSLLIPMIPIQTDQREGFKATPIVPIPTEPASWGESDTEAALQAQDVEFNGTDKGGNDLPPPLYAGSAVERDGGGRLVVLGSLQFITNEFLQIPDMEFARAGIPVARFPGNAELFTNSVFWLAKMETMIAISPAAMEVSRIEPMSESTLNAWRVGVLLVGLPLLVIAGGTMVYFARRD